MTQSAPFVLRDGLESDIAQCLALDHSYETDYVWQMTLHHDDLDQHEIMFRRERLPRTLEVEQYGDTVRLRAALAPDQCFLVASLRETPGEIAGYLTMRHDPFHKVGWIEDLMVARKFRRKGIGSRMIFVARSWAKEHRLSRLTVEIATKNYPAIVFCQTLGFSFCGFNDKYFVNQDIAVFFNQTIR